MTATPNLIAQVETALEKMRDDLVRAVAIEWINNNFSAFSAKSNATERLIAGFVVGVQVTWENATKELIAIIKEQAAEIEQLKGDNR